MERDVSAGPTLSSQVEHPYRAALLLSAAIVVVLFVVLAVAAIDISAFSEVHRDVLLGNNREDLRFADPSPFAVWLPSEIFIHRSYRRADLPLWDRSQGGGTSPAMMLYSGVFHPLRLLALAVPERLLGNFLILAILWLTFGGYFVLFRSERIATGVAALMATASALAPYSLSVLHYYGAALPLAHLPWAIWLYLGWRNEQRPRWCVALAVVIALILGSGHPSFLLTVAFCLASLTVTDLFTRRLPVRALTGVAGAVVGGLGLSAAAWLPFVRSFHYFWTYKTEHGSFHTVSFGRVFRRLALLAFDQPQDVGVIDAVSYYGHFGAPLIALALIGLFSVHLRRSSWGFAVIPIVGLIFAVPGPWLRAVASIPPVSFTKQWYVFAVLHAGVSLAAAFGLNAVYGRIRLRRALLAVVGLLLILAGASRLALAFKPWRITPDEFESPSLRTLRADRDLFRVTGLRGQVALANAAAWTGLEDLRICAPMLLDRYRMWFQAVDPEGVAASHQTLLTTRAPAWPLLAFFNVRYVLQSRIPSTLMHTWNGREGMERAEPEPGSGEPRDPYEPPADLRDPLLSPVMQNDAVAVMRLDATPRAAFFGDYRCVSSASEAAAGMKTDPTQSAKRPLVECSEKTDHSAGEGGSETSVRVSYPSNSEVRLELVAPEDGLVVLNEAWTPAWSAWVDGKRAALMPVNLLSRGVFVHRGAHMVRMSLEVPGLRAGSVISALSAVVLVGVAVSARRRRVSR